MRRNLAILIAFLISGFIFIYRTSPLVSAPPTGVKDTLSTSQLSYFARLGPGTTIGDSVVLISLNAGTAPSLTSNNLFVGDTLAIGTTGAGVGISGPLTIYTVKDIGNTATIQLSAGIGQSNAFTAAAIIATRSAIHTISFTPQSSATGGYWQFLIKATSRPGEVYNDGIPDQQGFDLGATTPSSGANGLGTRLKVTDVTCPNFGGGTSAFSVGTTTVIGTNSYNIITCALGAGVTNQVGIGYSVAIGADLASGSQLINPSAKDGTRTEGSADTYTFYVRHLDNTSTLIDADTIQGKIAVVESVRVTATIDPTLTFIIDNSNVGTGGTPCGLAAFGSQAANTTADAVPFGSISLGTFNDLAQRLSCITNSDSGYVITAYEANPMRNIADGTTIPDTTCPANSCSSTLTGLWTTNTASGWGYTLQNVGVGQSVFSYQQGYRAFGNGAANAQQIMRNTSTPTTTEVAYACYRLTAATTQEAGNYENQLIYTATATF
jgi:hypothetical protein